MEQEVKTKGIYYGWKIVAVCMCLMGVVFSTVVSLPGAFTVFVTEEWGITNLSTFTFHTTIAGLTGMAGALVVGKLLQQYNTKLLMSLAAIATAACFFGYSFASQVWHFYILSGIVGFVSMFIIHIAVALLVTMWFGPKLRGKAMGIAMTGSGIGTMILSPVYQYINSTYDWRLSYRLAGVLTLILVPLILGIIVKSPAEKGVQQLGAVENAPTVETVGLTTKQALKTPMFYAIFITFFLFSLTSLIFMVNAYPYFNVLEFTPVTAGLLISIASLAVIFGKLIIGAACDKWGSRTGATISISLLIIGLLLLIFSAQAPVLAYAAVAIFGIGNATATVPVPLIVGELFGNRDYGSLVGICNMGCSLGASTGPIIGALIFDSTGDFKIVWICTIVFMAVMMGTMYLAYKFKPGVYAKLRSQEETSGA